MCEDLKEAIERAEVVVVLIDPAYGVAPMLVETTKHWANKLAENMPAGRVPRIELAGGTLILLPPADE